jgi:hypothetical protein
MALKSLRAWLGVETHEEPEFAPLRETLEVLDRLEPGRARFLAAFAYLLSRVAGADQPRVVRGDARDGNAHGRAGTVVARRSVVVQLAKTSNLLFGGTANFLVARKFSAGDLRSEAGVDALPVYAVGGR